MANPDQLKSRVAQERERIPFVLVIDDHPEYSKIFELLSDSLGIKSYTVNSCREGLKMMESIEFDVVLMDWLMPDVDGPGCACIIRKIEEKTGAHVPIVAVSGSVRATREDCLAAGMDDFLPIPFTYEELHEMLCKWLKRENGPLPEGCK